MGRRDRLRRRSPASGLLLRGDPNLLPALPEGALQPGCAGIRPKIARPGGSTTDFLLQTEKDHGVAGLINLFGIESPGLTASLAIADWVAPRV
jgi:L-2-hydroxyglutarate oxidase LhgO